MDVSIESWCLVLLVYVFGNLLLLLGVLDWVGFVQVVGFDLLMVVIVEVLVVVVVMFFFEG